MRNLTIKREKSFVASLMKVKIYISDNNSNEIEINNMKCRKLGEISNGMEATYEIGKDNSTIFAIIDITSKEWCNDKYILNAGVEDISLSGKNKFSIFKGNPFRFNK